MLFTIPSILLGLSLAPSILAHPTASSTSPLAVIDAAVDVIGDVSVSARDLSDINTQYANDALDAVTKDLAAKIPAIGQKDKRLLGLGAAVGVKADIVVVVQGAVAELKGCVHENLEIITSILNSKDGCTVATVPKVTASLKAIIKSVKATTVVIVKSAIKLNLSVAVNLDEILLIVQDVLCLVGEIKTVVEALVAGVTSEVLALLSPIIYQLLMCLSPLTLPLIAFVRACVGTVTGAPELVTKVLGLVGEITSLVQCIISPVGDLLTGLLAVCLKCTIGSIL